MYQEIYFFVGISQRFCLDFQTTFLNGYFRKQREYLEINSLEQRADIITLIPNFH